LATTKSGLLDAAKGFAGAILPAVSFAAVAAAVAKGLKLAVDEAGKAETANVKLAGVLFSSGRGAEISAGQVDKFAASLMAATAIDDEAIKDAFAAIAGFENLPTGKMEDIVKIAADMSAMFGGDLASNATMVAGVLETGIIPKTWRFDKALKAQIQSQVEAGDTAGALSLMMAELNRRYGGQAVAQMNTYAGSVRELKTAWGEYWEAIGQGLIGPGKDINTWIAGTINAQTQYTMAINKMQELGVSLPYMFYDVGAGREAVIAWYTKYLAQMEEANKDSYEAIIANQRMASTIREVGKVAIIAAGDYAGFVDVARGVEAGEKSAELIYNILAKAPFMTDKMLADYALKSGLITQESYDTAINLIADATKIGIGYQFPVDQIELIRSGLSGIANMPDIVKNITINVNGEIPDLVKRKRPQRRKQFGGDVMGGEPYLIGEQGPELFVPPTSGRIIPNDKLPAGEVKNVHQNYYGPVYLTVPKEETPWQEL
jgi:hypothetical protein